MKRFWKSFVCLFRGHKWQGISDSPIPAQKCDRCSCKRIRYDAFGGSAGYGGMRD